jgi:hypothetical protein
MRRTGVRTAAHPAMRGSGRKHRRCCGCARREESTGIACVSVARDGLAMGRLERKLARAAAKKNKSLSASVPTPLEFRDTIERLRQLTRSATDLDAPWALFHDELAAAPGFNMAGVRAKNSRLRLVIEKAVQRVEPDCRCAAMLLLHFGDFWHGIMHTSLGPVVLYYFAHDDLGLLGFLGSEGGCNHLVRFSVFELSNVTSVDTVSRGQA